MPEPEWWKDSETSRPPASRKRVGRRVPTWFLALLIGVGLVWLVGAGIGVEWLVRNNSGARQATVDNPWDDEDPAALVATLKAADPADRQQAAAALDRLKRDDGAVYLEVVALKDRLMVRPPVELSDRERKLVSHTAISLREKLTYFHAMANMRGANRLVRDLKLTGDDAETFKAHYGMLSADRAASVRSAISRALSAGRANLSERDRRDLIGFEDDLRNIP